MTTDQKIAIYLLSVDMDALYKTFPSQKEQYKLAVPAPYTAKLDI